MIAGDDIGIREVFHVEGLNFVNPVTFRDTGHRAHLCARRNITKGETIGEGDYWPKAMHDGLYRNVNRPLTAEDVAIPGWGA